MPSELVTLHSWPQLPRPLLVTCLEGWIDAGQAAGSAMNVLRQSMPTELVATFDADELIDHRARRPVLRIVNGVETELRWPELRLEAATNPSGRGMLLLTGPEPDMRWHRFTDEVVALVRRLGVEMVVGLGAFPAPVPHTRPVRLAATSTDAELAGRIGFIPAAMDVPSGAQGAVEYALGTAGITSVGLWARVPHYASALPYPAASAALLDELAQLGGISIDTSELHTAGQATAAQIEQLISGSDEHVALVRQLEHQHDEEQGLAATDFGELPSADELADELQRFLRGEH
jgi:PAC2 family